MSKWERIENCIKDGNGHIFLSFQNEINQIERNAFLDEFARKTLLIISPSPLI